MSFLLALICESEILDLGKANMAEELGPHLLHLPTPPHTGLASILDWTLKSLDLDLTKRSRLLGKKSLKYSPAL
jgi:hypothetical protein